jgi:hypothetical protein
MGKLQTQTLTKAVVLKDADTIGNNLFSTNLKKFEYWWSRLGYKGKKKAKKVEIFQCFGDFFFSWSPKGWSSDQTSLRSKSKVFFCIMLIKTLQTSTNIQILYFNFSKNLQKTEIFWFLAFFTTLRPRRSHQHSKFCKVVEQKLFLINVCIF